MGHYLTYVLVGADSEIKDPVGEFLANAFGEMESRVNKILAPVCAELEISPYRRECDCLWHSAVDRAKDLPEWKVQGVSFVFTRDQFSRPGFELGWRKKVLELGSPDPDCDECGGSGITVARDNPASKWDGWEIGSGFADGVLNDCVIGRPANVNIVPVRDIDLDKLPLPDHIVTPEGVWVSRNDFIWSSSAVVVDENWEETARNVISQHKDATLVVVNCHL